MAVVLTAEFAGLRVSEVHFEPGYRQLPLDPEHPYIATVLEGGMIKSFPARSFPFESGMALTIPAGAVHSADCGRAGARLIAVRATNERTAALLRRVRVTRERGPYALAQRIAAELRASDAAGPLAVEGCALELLTAVARFAGPRERSRPPAWLARVRELLHEPSPPPLRAIADEIGVNASHLARVFRRHHGTSLAEYVRRIRLDHAAACLAKGELSIPEIAHTAGYSSQSHFTRAFKRHTGVPPAAYRHLLTKS